LEVDVLAAPPCGGGGSQIRIRYSIATGLRAVLLAVDDSRWAAPVSDEHRQRVVLQNGRTLYASLGSSF